MTHSATGSRASRVYIVEEQDNPSTDFFVLPAVARTCAEIIKCRFDDLPPTAHAEGAVVVFIRYVPREWRSWVESVHERLAGVIFFMDDDLLDHRSWAGLPLRYQFKLWRLARSRQQWLERIGAKMWVSTVYLQEKYFSWNPRLVLPAPIPARDIAFRRVFYHGSASHDADIRWLRPVVEEALVKDERLVFELIGGKQVYRLYRGLPRVNIVHPLKWPAYQAFLTMPGRHIGLAPLLESPFNRARSYTKFFDITQCGAVGIYSDASACADVVEPGLEGGVLPMEQGQWVETILALARDDERREQMVQNARRRVEVLAQAALERSKSL